MTILPPAPAASGKPWSPASWGLAARLILGLALLLVLILLFTVGSYRRTVEERRQAEVQSALDLARAMSALLDIFVRDIENTTLAMALALAQRPEPFSQARDGPYLRQILTDHRILRSLFVTNPRGRVVVSSSGEALGEDLSSRPYMQALQRGAPRVWSDLLLGLRTGTVTVAFARAIRRPDGSPRGFLVAAFDPERLLQTLPFGLPPDGRLTLFDRQGGILYTTGGLLSPEQRAAGDMPDVQEALRGRTVTFGSRRSRMTGEARFGAIVPVAGSGWAVAFTRPVAPLEAALGREFLGQAGAIGGVTLLAGLLAAALVTRMVRPLRVLARAAAAVARGERPTVGPVRDPPEAAALAEAIRTMSAAVAQREDALREALHVREHLYRLTEAVTRAEQLEEVYDRALEALLRGLGADRAAILLRDAGGVMRFVRAAGLSPAYCAAVEGHSPWPPATPDPQPVVIPDVALGLEPPLRETVLGEGIRAMAFFPLVAEGRLIGKFMVYHDTPHTFRDAEVQAAAAIAGHVAFAIQRHRAEEARRRMERAQRYLAEASRVLSESLDYERTLHEVARLAMPALADLCLVDLRGDDGVVRRVAAAHADPAHQRLVEVLRRYAPDPTREVGAGRVLRTRQPEVVQPMDEAWLERVAQDAVHLQVLRELGVAAQMTVPLLARGTVLGTIVFAACDPRRRFDAEDLALAEELGRRAALAIENARLYARERHIAETLQRSLLPDRLPDIPGLRVAARYLPAGPEAEVGGDWYDVLALPTGQVALVMGDVAGRGVRAAAVVGQLRNAVRAYALEGHPPALIAERLNALLSADEMATFLYVTLDLDAGRVRFVNAGHVPPLVVAPEGRVVALEGGSLPLGILPHARYPEGEAALAPGALLLLFTDGLVEARGRSLDDGLAALHRAAAETAGVEAPAEVLDRLIAALRGREAPVDDVAVLAARPAPLPLEGLRLRFPAVPASLPALRHTLKRWLTAARVPPAEAYEILVAAGEASSNAVEHAYGAADGTFAVETAFEDGAVTVTVQDWGRWRAPRGAHRGRGLGLIRALMDTVEVDRSGAGTTVRMQRRIRQGAPG